MSLLSDNVKSSVNSVKKPVSSYRNFDNVKSIALCTMADMD